jgi:tRNA nucleotidyltransferase (CCA-adding enzyme)
VKVYLVGGAVRDQLLGKAVHERDYVVVGATPQEMLAQGFRQVGKDFPVFLHPETGEEYALARTERKSGRGYTGFEIAADTSVTLEQDLLRRDLTINAIAQDDDGSLIDPYGGLNDLEARLLRHVSSAFVEDPLRLLRVARFAARFAEDGFAVAADTLKLMREISAAGELEDLANERVWQETVKALQSTRPGTYFAVLAQANSLTPWFAELEHTSTRERVLQRLHRFPAQQAEIAFAVWQGELTAEQVDACCQRLRVPTEWQHLARLACHWHAAKQDLTASENLVACLQQADCWRRTERLSKLLEIWQHQGLTAKAKERIAAAYQAALNVAAKDVIAAAEARGETLAGPAIGAAVQQARAAAITTALTE